MIVKMRMDHIEDFANHRVWGLRKEFGEYFPDINKLRLAYFYSRGDLEPYILIDDEFTEQIYGKNNNPKMLLHYTSEMVLREFREQLIRVNLLT